jgi:serine/threonine-protein kinase RsbW
MDAISVPGKLESLKAIAEYIMTASKEAGLPKRSAYNLRLAVDEIVTNIILHGYEEQNLEGNIDLKADLDDTSLSISVEDTAVSYNPYDTPAVAQDELDLPIEQKKLGGLGVYLAIQGVDKFIYERVNKKNRNIFVVNKV